MSQIGLIEQVGSGQESIQQFQKTLGKDEFLRLLVAQLSHQDPMSPMESQEFATQLAQFSSLEQLRNIDESIGEGVSVDLVLTQAINNTLAATLIGKEVTARGNEVTLTSGETMNLHFQLEDFAEEVMIDVLDEGGTVVRSMSSHSLSGGQHMLTWDGRNSEGRRLPEGTYRFRVSAKDGSGNSVGAASLVIGVISSVRYDEGKAILMVGGREIAFSDVLEIGMSGG